MLHWAGVPVLECFVLDYGDVTLDLKSGILRRDGQTLFLTATELQLLDHLHARGSVVSRAELLTEALGYHAETASRSLDMLLSRLRKKIERDPKKPRVLITVRGKGVWLAPPPPRAVAFVGRDAERTEIARALGMGRVVTLVGLPGIGKSVVAEAALADGMYISCSGGGEPRVRLEAGIGAPAACDERELIAHVASLDLRCLGLDLGPVSPSSELKHLIGQLCAVVPLCIVSRVPLDLAREEVVRLGPLARESSIALLGRRMDAASPETLDALAAHAHDHPMVLLGLASLAPDIAPEDLLQIDLLDLPRGAGGLKSSLDALWRSLPEPFGTRLRSLAAFRGRFTAKGAAAVLDCSMGQCLAMLSDAAGRALVQASGGRYALDPLVRRSLADTVPPEALGRWRSFVLQRAEASWTEGEVDREALGGDVLALLAAPDPDDPWSTVLMVVQPIVTIPTAEHIAVLQDAVAGLEGPLRDVHQLGLALAWAHFGLWDRALAIVELLPAPPDTRFERLMLFCRGMGNGLPVEEHPRLAALLDLRDPLHLHLDLQLSQCADWPTERVQRARDAALALGFSYLAADGDMALALRRAWAGEHLVAARLLQKAPHSMGWQLVLAAAYALAAETPALALALECLTELQSLPAWRVYPRFRRAMAWVIGAIAHWEMGERALAIRWIHQSEIFGLLDRFTGELQLAAAVMLTVAGEPAPAEVPHPAYAPWLQGEPLPDRKGILERIARRLLDAHDPE